MFILKTVTSGVFPPSYDFNDPLSAALLHNHAIYSTFKRFQDFGTDDPDIDTWVKYINERANHFEETGILPKGTIDVVKNVTDVITNATENTTFDELIASFQKVHQNAVDNANYNKTALVCVTGIAYNSTVLYSQINADNPDSGATFKFKIPRWLKIVCADIGGAIGGAGLGVAGAIVGGVAGSIAAS